MNTPELKNIAKRVRKHIIEMIAEATSGHPGGSLSITDILTVLYFDKMNINPDDPKWEDRDRLVLSKGHAAATVINIHTIKPIDEESIVNAAKECGKVITVEEHSIL